MGRRYPGGPFDPFEQSPFSGLQEFRIPRPPRRVWIGLAFVGGGILLLFVAAPLIGFLTETQWFQALGLGSVYLTRVALQAWLGVLHEQLHRGREFDVQREVVVHRDDGLLILQQEV